MGTELLRYGTIIFSLASLPLLGILFTSIYNEYKKNNGIDKKVALLLISLFIMLFVTAFMSLSISTLAHYQGKGVVTIELTPVSRVRSFFFSISNFMTSLAFYLLQRSGGK